MIARINGKRSVRLAATFTHRNRTSEIEYGFPVAPVGAKRRILNRWLFPDGTASEWGQDAYTGAVTLATFEEWHEKLSR